MTSISTWLRPILGDRRFRDPGLDRVLLAVYLACVLVIGITFSFRFTPMSGIDEEYHFKRALQLAQGEPFARHLGSNQYGGRLDRRAVAMEHWFDVVRNDAKPTNVADAGAAEAAIANLPPGRDMHWFPSTASYPPLPYAPAAAGLLAAQTLHLELLRTLLVGRLASLFTYLALVGVIVATLPVGRLAALACLTTPTVISLAASFSADPISLALPVLFVALCMRLALVSPSQFGNGHRLGLLLLGMSLGLLKLTCCLSAFMVLLIPIRHFRRPMRGWCYRAALIAVCLGTTALWNADYPFVPGVYWSTGADPTRAIHTMLIAPFRALQVILATLWSGTHWWWTDAFSRFGGGPRPYFFKIEGIWPPLGFVVMVSLLLADPARCFSPKAAVLLALVALVELASVLLAFQVGFTAPGGRIIIGLQGRYFLLPLILMLLAIASLLPERGCSILQTILAARFAALAACCVTTVVAVAALQRYALLWR